MSKQGQKGFKKQKKTFVCEDRGPLKAAGDIIRRVYRNHDEARLRQRVVITGRERRHHHDDVRAA